VDWLLKIRALQVGVGIRLGSARRSLWTYCGTKQLMSPSFNSQNSNYALELGCTCRRSRSDAACSTATALLVRGTSYVFLTLIQDTQTSAAHETPQLVLWLSIMSVSATPTVASFAIQCGDSLARDMKTTGIKLTHAHSIEISPCQPILPPLMPHYPREAEKTLSTSGIIFQTV
jgi:hypothetical protein